MGLTLILALPGASQAGGAQSAETFEAGIGLAWPMGGTGKGRVVGPAAHLAVRFAAANPRNTSLRLLLDVGYMPGRAERTCASCVATAQSPLLATTVAISAHIQSPTAASGVFSEVGVGMTHLSQTAYDLSVGAPLLLASIGWHGHAWTHPVRLGVAYHATAALT